MSRTVIARKTFTISAADLKEQFRQDRLLRVDRQMIFMGGGGMARVKFMAEADGYVMARRPGCAPFVMPRKEWMAAPLRSDADGEGHDHGDN